MGLKYYCDEKTKSHLFFFPSNLENVFVYLKLYHVNATLINSNPVCSTNSVCVIFWPQGVGIWCVFIFHKVEFDLSDPDCREFRVYLRADRLSKLECSFSICLSVCSYSISPVPDSLTSPAKGLELSLRLNLTDVPQTHELGRNDLKDSLD